MVDGQLKKTGALVVDLDGTLVRCNTLHLYLGLGFRYAGPLKKIAISWLIALRRLRLITHESMKYRALKLAGKSSKLSDEFRCRFDNMVRREIMAMIDDTTKRGGRVLLATAASESYVPLIWHGEFIASPWGGPDLKGTAKRDAVLAWLKKNDLRLEAFATDHSDDLPMAIAARELGADVIIVGATPASAKAFNEKGFSTVKL